MKTSSVEITDSKLYSWWTALPGKRPFKLPSVELLHIKLLVFQREYNLQFHLPNYWKKRRWKSLIDQISDSIYCPHHSVQECIKCPYSDDIKNNRWGIFNILLKPPSAMSSGYDNFGNKMESNCHGVRAQSPCIILWILWYG